MKTLPREEANKLWARWWDELAQEWFKLEVLQDYSGEDNSPSLQNWLKGDRQKSIKLMSKHADHDFLRRCQAKVKNGVSLIRVHIVAEPYTPYIEWEIEFYKHVNIPLGGEQVYLVPQKLTKDLDVPEGDLMIFDDKRAVVNTYNSKGRMTQETFYDESDDTANFIRLKNEIIKLAKPIH